MGKGEENMGKRRREEAKMRGKGGGKRRVEEKRYCERREW